MTEQIDKIEKIENIENDEQNHEREARAITLALIFFVLGCFFKFVLIGYQTIALLFWGLSALTLLLHYLPKRWMRCLVVAFTLAGALCLCIIEIPIVAASRGDNVRDAEYLIVLGAGVNGTEPSLTLYNRLTAAEEWLVDHPDSVAILSGGQGTGEQISEAEAMYRYLVENGIDEERLYKEERSTTTRENFQYSAELLRTLQDGVLPQSVAVVSSEFHLYRAKAFAEQTGLKAVGVPAKTTYPVLRLNYFIREGAAVARLWMLGY